MDLHIRIIDYYVHHDPLPHPFLLTPSPPHPTFGLSYDIVTVRYVRSPPTFGLHNSVSRAFLSIGNKWHVIVSANYSDWTTFVRFCKVDSSWGSVVSNHMWIPRYLITCEPQDLLWRRSHCLFATSRRWRRKYTDVHTKERWHPKVNTSATAITRLGTFFNCPSLTYSSSFF